MLDGVIFILTSNKFHFIRIHESLVQDPSNNKSIPGVKFRWKVMMDDHLVHVGVLVCAYNRYIISWMFHQNFMFSRK